MTTQKEQDIFLGQIFQLLPQKGREYIEGTEDPHTEIPRTLRLTDSQNKEAIPLTILLRCGAGSLYDETPISVIITSKEGYLLQNEVRPLLEKVTVSVIYPDGTIQEFACNTNQLERGILEFTHLQSAINKDFHLRVSSDPSEQAKIFAKFG